MLAHVKWLGGTACPPATFRENVEINRARGLPELKPGAVVSEPLYIVGSGPSLRDTAHELAGAKTIWALNAAHDWLIHQGIFPSHGVCMAPEAPVLNYFKQARTGIDYLLASHTNPDLVSRIIADGGKVTLWHAHCPEEWGVEYPEDQAVYGGGTIGLRAFDLAWVCGYRDIHVLGFDACNSPDGRIAVETPMYEERKKDLRTFIINGRAFVALPSHARQVEDFARVVRPLEGMNITFYGDGLMQWAQMPHASA